MRYVSHLACPTCGATYPADRLMNLCERDGRPVQMVLDIPRLKAERGPDGGWDPSRRDLWRFGGLLPLDIADPEDRRSIVSLGEGNTPGLDYAHPWADRLGCRFEVKDEGRHHPGFGANPTLSFKDRGMAMTVSMARALGLSRLAVPTQGNAGDSLATYALAAGIEAVDRDVARHRPARSWGTSRPWPSSTRPRSPWSWSPGRSSTARRGSASITSPGAISASRRSRSRAGGPRGRRPWAWRWPSPGATGWPSGPGACPT